MISAWAFYCSRGLLVRCLFTPSAGLHVPWAFASAKVFVQLETWSVPDAARQIKRMISSYVGENKLFEELRGAYGIRMFHQQLSWGNAVRSLFPRSLFPLRLPGVVPFRAAGGRTDTTGRVTWCGEPVFLVASKEAAQIACV